jgi:hypothetical protein
MIFDEDKFRVELVDWYLSNPIPNPFSLTITLKQRVGSHQLDVIGTSTNTKHFLNRLNKKVFGNRFQRFGIRLKSFVVIEGDSDHRLHTHMIIEKPIHLSDERFRSLVKESIEKTKFGYNQIQIDPLITELDETKWFLYLTKRRSKTDLSSNIDWMNTTIGKMS